MQFTNMTVEWSTKTFVFYLAIIIGSYLIDCGLKRKTVRWGKGKKKKYSAGLLIVSIILLAIKCFNTTGRDLRAGYHENFLSATSMASYRDQTIEPGFRLLTVIVRVLTNNYAVFLFLVGVLTILPVIHLIYKYRNRIDVPAAILMYTSIYFINSFSACRQYLAVSVSLFAFDAMIENKPYKALMWIAVSSTIHVTCLVLVIPYVLYFAKLFSKRMIAISALVLVAAFYLGRNSISSILASSGRYAIYLANQQVSFGFEQLVYYAPMFWLLFICRKQVQDRSFFRLSYIYLITGFAFGMLSYVVPVFGRMQATFLPIVIIIPYYIKTYRERHRRISGMVNAVTIFYCLARFIIWISQYYNMENLMPYTNIFNHII